MFLRYIDDANLIVKKINNDITFDEETKEMKMKADNVNDDPKHTMKTMKKVANSITQMIQWEEDVPENHPDEKLPILDMKVWVEREEKEHPIIHHEFYKKPVSNPELINSK